jgi:hypothetical protein
MHALVNNHHLIQLSTQVFCVSDFLRCMSISRYCNAQNTFCVFYIASWQLNSFNAWRFAEQPAYIRLGEMWAANSIKLFHSDNQMTLRFVFGCSNWTANFKPSFLFQWWVVTCRVCWWRIDHCASNDSLIYTCMNHVANFFSLVMRCESF